MCLKKQNPVARCAAIAFGSPWSDPPALSSTTIAGYSTKIIMHKHRTFGAHPGGGGFLVQRSIRGRAAEMGLKISLLV